MAEQRRDNRPIMSEIWNEVKNINWQLINMQTHKQFSVGLMGSGDSISKMKDWLKSFDYKLAVSYGALPKKDLQPEDSRLESHVTLFPAEKDGPDEGLLRSVEFCLVDMTYKDLASKTEVCSYVFDQNRRELARDILANHQPLRFALSYNFPVFRIQHSDIEVNATALQNTTWAVTTAAPNLLPGAHQIVTAPIEAVSDFVVLTANEVKLLFELVGLSGHIVNPLACLIEFGIVLGLAKGAQVIASNIVGKVPAGAGLLVKGAVAYAFTWAIGEAIFFYLSTGQKAGMKFLEDRMRHYYGAGIKVAGKALKRIQRGGR